MTDLTRADNWEDALFCVVQTWQARCFAWGRYDCAHFAADVVAAVTGTDVLHRFEHLYTDKQSAADLLTELGGMAEATTRVLGKPVDTMQARRGDIVTVKAPQGDALGVVIGVEAVALTAEGLRPFSVGLWQACWRIG